MYFIDVLVFSAAAKQGGIMADSDYRYLGFQSACRFDRTRVAASIKSAVRYFVKDENQLRELVYTYGPVAAGIIICTYAYSRTNFVFRFKEFD